MLDIGPDATTWRCERPVDSAAEIAEIAGRVRSGRAPAHRADGNQFAEKMERSPTWPYRLENNDRADPQAVDLDSTSAVCDLSTYETRYLYLLADKVPPAVGLSHTSMTGYLEFFRGPAVWIDGSGTLL